MGEGGLAPAPAPADRGYNPDARPPTTAWPRRRGFLPPRLGHGPGCRQEGPADRTHAGTAPFSLLASPPHFSPLSVGPPRSTRARGTSSAVAGLSGHRGASRGSLVPGRPPFNPPVPFSAHRPAPEKGGARAGPRGAARSPRPRGAEDPTSTTIQEVAVTWPRRRATRPPANDSARPAGVPPPWPLSSSPLAALGSGATSPSFLGRFLLRSRLRGVIAGFPP